MAEVLKEETRSIEGFADRTGDVAEAQSLNFQEAADFLGLPVDEFREVFREFVDVGDLEFGPHWYHNGESLVLNPQGLLVFALALEEKREVAGDGHLAKAENNGRKRGKARKGRDIQSFLRFVRKQERRRAQDEPDEPTDENLAELASSAEILENGEDALALGEIEEDRFDDAVYLYLREVGPIPLLTAVEEVDLAQRIERGKETEKFLKSNYSQLTEGERRDLQGVIEDGRKARDHFIKANARLVISIAKRYVGRGVPFLDLIQEGNLGLMRAVEKFDWRKGFKFSTYATWWIRQAVTRAIGDQGRTIRVPVHMGEKISKMRRFIHKFRQENGEAPTDEEVMEELGVNRKQFELLIRASKRELSLEMPIGEEEDSTLGDLIQDPTAEDVPEKAGLNVLRDGVREVLHSLTPREARILELRYGLGGGRTHTLEEVGRKFGLTRERIRQIEAKALRKLRNPVRARKLREYV